MTSFLKQIEGLEIHFLMTSFFFSFNFSFVADFLHEGFRCALASKAKRSLRAEVKERHQRLRPSGQRLRSSPPSALEEKKTQRQTIKAQKRARYPFPQNCAGHLSYILSHMCVAEEPPRAIAQRNVVVGAVGHASCGLSSTGSTRNTDASPVPLLLSRHA